MCMKKILENKMQKLFYYSRQGHRNMLNISQKEKTRLHGKASRQTFVEKKNGIKESDKVGREWMVSSKQGE